MTYWPKNWECKRIVGNGDGCIFYDPTGVNNQCSHPNEECIFPDREILYKLHAVEPSRLESDLDSGEVPVLGK